LQEITDKQERFSIVLKRKEESSCFRNGMVGVSPVTYWSWVTGTLVLENTDHSLTPASGNGGRICPAYLSWDGRGTCFIVRQFNTVHSPFLPIHSAALQKNAGVKQVE
jgi:hypothetical protein